MALQRKYGEVEQAGARLIAAADGGRRQLERDLHDGAQQRLVSLSVRLRLLARRLAPGVEPGRRPPEAVEAAAYYLVSEALNTPTPSRRKCRSPVPRCEPRSRSNQDVPTERKPSHDAPSATE